MICKNKPSKPSQTFRQLFKLQQQEQKSTYFLTALFWRIKFFFDTWSKPVEFVRLIRKILESRPLLCSNCDSDSHSDLWCCMFGFPALQHCRFPELALGGSGRQSKSPKKKKNCTQKLLAVYILAIWRWKIRYNCLHFFHCIWILLSFFDCYSLYRHLWELVPIETRMACCSCGEFFVCFITEKSLSLESRYQVPKSWVNVTFPLSQCIVIVGRFVIILNLRFWRCKIE